MLIYEHQTGIGPAPEHLHFKAPAGFIIATGATRQAVHVSTAGAATIEGAALTRVDAGLTLDEAHALLTDGLTKAELVTLGAELDLALSATSLKDDLLFDIMAHLEGLQ